MNSRQHQFTSTQRWNLTRWILAVLTVVMVLSNLQQVSAQTRGLIEQFSADESSLRFKYRNPSAPATLTRMAEFYSLWKTRAFQTDFATLNVDGKIDTILLRNYAEQKERDFNQKIANDKIASRLVPFLEPLYSLLEQNEATRDMKPQLVAESFEEVSQTIDKFNRSLLNLFSKNRTVVLRAIAKIEDCQRSLDEYNRFHNRYDPLYMWWVSKPYEKLAGKLKGFADELKIIAYGTTKPTDQIIGNPIGKVGLQTALKHAFIPYTVGELIDIANQELNWCDSEMRKASKELGFVGWKDAQDHVKSKFVKPGEQPKLINDLAIEAVNFLEMNNLITIPAIAKETWRMRMMSPERQKMSPYFLGGHTILVAYPTGEMSHADKMMSMRGNNPFFARATVHHELIPGHHLQYFMNKRHKPYRQIFGTPFWLEGWAVYWETLLWDLGFARSPEEKIGMLFWRKHRCARIIFSLNYHSGLMTPDECIEFLVNRVGHEKNNATAEVRRSVMGGYGPLYQAAYMIGALQFRRLHDELVKSGKMTNREFHDTILKENNIPVELLRAKLLGKDIPADFEPSWRFYDRN